MNSDQEALAEELQQVEGLVGGMLGALEGTSLQSRCEAMVSQANTLAKNPLPAQVEAFYTELSAFIDEVAKLPSEGSSVAMKIDQLRAILSKRNQAA